MTPRGLADERLVLNVDSKGNLLFNGEVLTSEAGDPEDQARGPDRPGQHQGPQAARSSPTQELPARVVIRADRDTPFSALFGLINTCQTNGYVRSST